MTRLHIPAVRDGAGLTIPATASIRLERAPQTPLETWRPVIGFFGAALATEHAAISIPAGGILVELTPQSAIALPDGAATAYAVRIETAHRAELHRIQVPDTAAEFGLAELVGVQALEPGGLLWDALLVQTGEDRLATAADRVQTGLDRLAAGEDAAATAADRVQTGADRTQTALDRIATAADRVQTGLDRTATAADRTQAGADRTAAAASASSAAAAAVMATAGHVAQADPHPLQQAQLTGLIIAALDLAGQSGRGLAETVATVNAALAAQTASNQDSIGSIPTLVGVLQAALDLAGEAAAACHGGRVFLAAGSAADPALRIGTVGVYSSAADTLSVAIAGVERLRVTASGITVYGAVTTVP